MIEQDKIHQQTNEITHIGMSVALLIAGGFAILFLSRLFPIPGTKYLLMGPYIALIMSAVAYAYPRAHIILKINVVLAGILSIITIYMGLAILITGWVADLAASVFVHKKIQGIAIGVSYAAFTVLTSVIISKYIIGDAIFFIVDIQWIAITVIIASILGGIAGFAGRYIGMRVNYAFKRR